MRLRYQVMVLMAIPLTGMLVMLALLAWLSIEAHVNEMQDTRFDRLQLLSRNIEGGLRGAESSMRGYVATLSPAYLASFRQFSTRVENLTGELVGQSEDNARQHERAHAIASLAASQLFQLRRNISLADSSRERAIGYVRNFPNDAAAAPVHRMLDDYIADEDVVLGASDQAVSRGWRILTIGYGLSFVLSIVLIVVFASFLSQRIVARLGQIREKLHRVAAGDDLGPGDISRDEIGDVDRALQHMSQELRESSAALNRYGLLAKTAREAFLFIDRETLRIVEANQAALDWLGYDHRQITSLSIYDLLPPERRANVTNMMEKVATEGICYESIGLRADGTVFPIEFSARSGKLDNRDVVLAVVRDLTERVQRQRELSRALEEALAADKLKSDFVATVSHEIRTPMNGIIGMSELMLRTQLDADQRDLGQTIHDSAITLLRIINDILDFSKLQAGRAELESIEFEITPLVEGVVELVSRSRHRESVSMMTYIAPDVPRLLTGDPGRLRQILMNLVGNAAKFTEIGHIHVSVGLEGELRGGRATLRFVVSDTGIGMTEETKAKLFEPFSQGDASTTRRFGGTGLGLVITKAYVELMGGSISVDSIPEVGTKLSFTASLEVPSIDKPVDQKTLLMGKRVLIVESDAATQRLFERYARDWEMQVAIADGLTVALNSLREAAQRGEPFDFAIVEQSLLDGDGLDLGHQIKHDSSIASTRMMMIVATGEAGLAESARACGFDAIVSKPIVQSHVYDRLVAMLNVRSVAPSLPILQTQPEEQRKLNRSYSVLLVEDNAVNVQVAARQLRYIGCEVTSVDNGKAAVEILERRQFDLVLMDCNMPVMDGYTATRHIRQNEVEQQRRRLPIVAMTANASEADRERCIGAGMDEFISKPVVLDALRSVIERILANEASVEA